MKFTPSARVVMLLGSKWSTDSRVIREATALANGGYDVHVISDDGGDTLETTTSNGVTYHCLPCSTRMTALTYLPRMAMLHWRVSLIRIKDDLRRGKKFQLVLRCAFICSQMLAFIVASICGTIVLSGVVILPLLFFGIARLLSRCVRTLFPGYHGGKGTLHDAYTSVSKVFARFISILWRLFHAILNIVGIDSLRYLNHFGVRAFNLACEIRPHIVHAHDLVTLSGGFAVSKALGIPLIYDAHELETHTNYWGLSRRTRRWIAFYEETLCRQTHAVITVCESIADWLRDHYDIRRPIVVHNTPDFSQGTATELGKPKLREVLRLNSGIALAVYVGSVTIDRGIEQCVEALAHAPDLHMAFVGPRYSETEKNIRALSQQWNVEARVHLVDPVPSAEVTNFISDADCSVMAIQNVCLSYYFCFPNKLLESVLAGVPVVAARLVELERFVGRFHVGLITDETDPKALASAIQSVILNKSDFQISSTIRSEIIKLYGWPIQRERLLKLYTQLSGQHPDSVGELTGSERSGYVTSDQSRT